MSKKSRGEILTFYSYKGGTGRTMALANVAWIMASTGKKVLVVDWDLEAPGLHRWFAPFLHDPQLTDTEGLLEFLLAYVVAATSEPPTDQNPDPEWYRKYADISRYTSPLTWGFNDGGMIDLVAAGRQNEAYAHLVNQFDWDGFYEQFGGGAFMDAVGERIREEYDYILIDSRTGISDTSGICTVQLPDKLVVLFTMNNQSIEGVSHVTADVVRQWKKLNREPLIFPIPTRIELAEKEKLQARRDLVKKSFDPFLDHLGKKRSSYWGTMEIMYQAFYAYEEILATIADQPGLSTSLLSALERITGFLTENKIKKLEMTEKDRKRALGRYPVRSGPIAEAAIDKSDLQHILSEHDEWVSSKGSRGKKAILKGRDLSGEIISNATLLNNADFSHANMERVDFQGASLIEANFIGANLEGANLDSCQLVDANFTKANLRGASLQSANLSGAHLNSAMLERSDLSNSIFRKTQVEGASFRGADLTGADLRSVTGLTDKQVEDTIQNQRTIFPWHPAASEEPSTDITGHGVFLIRPFGVKNGIDFDRVEEELIRPALNELRFSGGTTGEFMQQGNIRTDMFEQLLFADLVIADISIHNASAFYALGIRHAFRDKRTFLIKSESDQVPFDLRTDRYLPYNSGNPAASLPDLIDGLRATLDSQKQDSPVFQLLPGLKPADPANFLLVPTDFRKEVERAELDKNQGYLQLLSEEVEGFAWSNMGLRLIGRKQFELKDWLGAKLTWEAVRKYGGMDLEANTLLGTIYQRLDDLVRSDQALERAFNNAEISGWDRAEIWALMARNAKSLWEADWNTLGDTALIQNAALSSPHIEKSYQLYRKGFAEDRNHFYSGLNALAMATIITELASVLPEVWEEDFDSEDEAAIKLRKLKEFSSDLAAAVKLSIESRRKAMARKEMTDIWAEISAADLIMLTSKKPKRVGRAYKKALANAPDFACDAARQQLLRYQPLGVLTENTQTALDNIPVVEEEKSDSAPRVILFAGHRIDAPDRQQPRFPAAREDQARDMILAAVSREREKAPGQLLGISGGASGGDILFHEICQELGIPTQMYLVLPKNEYIKASVADGGPDWVERFKRLFEQKQPAILSESGELPRWLRAKRDYSIWQRSNLWMLHSGLAISNDNLMLIALWNGEADDGPGGTQDMVERAKNRGATFIHLDARKLLE